MISVCVPAFQASSFIGNLIGDLRRQIFSNFIVLISNDGADEQTAMAFNESASDDKRFKMYSGARRGWVDNCNFLLSLVDTEYFCIMPHDDRINENYLYDLYKKLNTNRDYVAAYCSVETFGLKSEKRSIEDLNGEQVARIFAFLGQPYQGGPWRALTRSSCIDQGLRMPSNEFDGFQADLAYVLQLVVWGPLLKIEEAHYRRWIREDRGSVTAGWRKWPFQRTAAAWVAHTVDCWRIIDASEMSFSVKRNILAALVVRLLDHVIRHEGEEDLTPVGDRLTIGLLSIISFMEQVHSPYPTEQREEFDYEGALFDLTKLQVIERSFNIVRRLSSTLESNFGKNIALALLDAQALPGLSALQTSGHLPVYTNIRREVISRRSSRKLRSVALKMMDDEEYLKAARVLDKAGEIDPGSYKVALTASKNYEMLWDIKKSLTLARRAMELRPSDSKLVDSVARLERLLKRQKR